MQKRKSAGRSKRKSAAAADWSEDEAAAEAEEEDEPQAKRAGRRRGSRGVQAGRASSGALEDITNEDMESLMAMGFDKKKSAEALMEAGHNLEAAVAWLFENCAM